MGRNSFISRFYVCCSIFSLFFVAPLAVANMALSDYRLFFDSGSRSNAIQIRNTASQPLQFTTQILHYRMTEEGTLEEVTGPDAMIFSAKPLLRYSPKRATIPPLSIQAIRFSVRKPRNLADGEYRAVLRITGTEVNTNGAGINIRSRLSYNLPIIIRHGELAADVGLMEPQLVNQNGIMQVQLWQTRTGNRSLYGGFIITDEDGNEVGRLNGIGLYPPIERRKVLIPLTEEAKGNLVITFTEDLKYGGDKVAKIPFSM